MDDHQSPQGRPEATSSGFFFFFNFNIPQKVCVIMSERQVNQFWCRDSNLKTPEYIVSSSCYHSTATFGLLLIPSWCRGFVKQNNRVRRVGCISQRAVGPSAALDWNFLPTIGMVIQLAEHKLRFVKWRHKLSLFEKNTNRSDILYPGSLNAVLLYLLWL